MTQTTSLVVTIFTDGACSGNPGPGGWGALLRYGSKERELFGGELATTNNRMELTAVIRALDTLTRSVQVAQRSVLWREHWERPCRITPMQEGPLTSPKSDGQGWRVACSGEWQVHHSRGST